MRTKATPKRAGGSTTASVNQIYHGSEDLNHKIAKFLKLVAYGEQEEAEGLLKTEPNIALMFGDLTDCAEREFKQITGFQYAVWALDWHMWNMILKYMPLEIIKEQLNNLKNGSWVKEHGISLSWQPLIEAMEQYINNCGPWFSQMCNNTYWNQVGNAQLTLPAHVIQEFSRKDRAFSYNPPQFNEQTLPRGESRIVEAWFEHLKTINVAWVRASFPELRLMEVNIHNRIECEVFSVIDSKALTQLLKVRTKQCSCLFDKYNVVNPLNGNPDAKKRLYHVCKGP